MADFTVNEGGLQRPDLSNQDNASPLQERHTRESQRNRTAAARIENLLGSDEEGVRVALSQGAERRAAQAAEAKAARLREPTPERANPTYSRSEGGQQARGGDEILPGALIDILI